MTSENSCLAVLLYYVHEIKQTVLDIPLYLGCLKCLFYSRVTFFINTKLSKILKYAIKDAAYLEYFDDLYIN